MNLQKTWENARNYCKNLAPNNGGDLVSIHDTETNNYLGNLGQTGKQAWIGAFRQSSDPEDWAWTDGSAFDYSNWHYQEGIQSHVIMLWSSWAWANADEGQWKRFFCQQNK